MPATSVFTASSDRAAAVEAVVTSRSTSSQPITVIRRRPHPPMRGDDRLGRRLSRAISSRGAK